ncbi:phosphatase PAP2 family protein [Pseudoalteromonas sp. OOF1S-7]|uniref:phosphatase PAP2 family protein n=1 Tax=Pseudoalteromonas sp. OOF1S-7 TaxID=2917757 RepID=UPI001EF46643|nr:phosphatase PAP2 family protein [Pseudoalteromonas sp. OOF1S-7]MCG7537516.1 phosphatase PAP2 family protein [Pseudoalteromonas sp. OOF1S-7]
MDLLNKPEQKKQPNEASCRYEKFKQLDYRFCEIFNKLNHIPRLSKFLGIISILGNGRFWYALILLQPAIAGKPGLLISLSMMLTGLITLVLYLWIKKQFQRDRPFIKFPDIKITESAIDLYSFPSGHTMHSVCFSIMLVSSNVYWGFLVVPFTILVSLSRVVLGLHYPSDVIVGAFIGASVATTFLFLAQLSISTGI